MGASDRARTETRAFLMVASVDCSTGLDDEFINLGALFGAQLSDSGLSSRPIALSFDTNSIFFRGDPDSVLSSDEECE